MTRGRFALWEMGVLVHAALLAVWLTAPGPLWALAAAGSALATVVLALRAGRLLATAALVVTVAGAWSAASTSRRVRRVERNWPTDSSGVRWQVVDKAGKALGEELADAVATVFDLAAIGERQVGATRRDAFRALAEATRGDGPERGAVVLDATGRPLAWGGRHRVPPPPSGTGLIARITPFYATLEAWRQGPDGSRAGGHVVLQADRAVPDREATLGARFARATGVGLEFYPPGRGPFWADVFDYCFPSCSDTTAVPDTLFSVRMVPPTQGAYKLALLADGGRWVAVWTVALLALLIVVGSTPGRVAGAVGVAGLLGLTPAGSQLQLGTLFSPATYFAELLGPLTSSSGTLLIGAAVALLAGTALCSRRLPRTPLNLVGAAVLIVVAPPVLRSLAAGITPPAVGSDLVLWLQWEIPITVATAAVLVLAAALVRSTRASAPAPRWMAVLAGTLAAAAGVVGLLLWEPGAGWSAWYVYLWLPAIALAIQPGSGIRLVTTTAVAAGSAAALLTWGAAADGRLLLAERDVEGLRQRGDAVAVGLLERFGARLQEERVPTTAAELYARWRTSTLHQDRYPVVLSTWSRTGALVARLELADLGFEPEIIQGHALAARDQHAPNVEDVLRAPGMHYILTVPYPDGSVVTVGLGPRSRVIPPVRIARFLRGERVLAPPYELAISEPMVGEEAGAGRLAWRREGWTVRGQERLEFPDGVRALLVSVRLGGFASLVMRGALVVLLDVLVIAGLWLLGEALAGRARVPPLLRELVRRRSYRTRLALAFALFFVVPTVGFAAWSGRRLAAEAGRSRDIMIRQTLLDAAGTVSDFPGMPELLVRELLKALSDRLNADLVLYTGGTLQQASAPVLVELGVLDRFLPWSVFTSLTRREIDVAADQRIADRATRVGYRNLGGRPDAAAVLAVPRLVEDPALIRTEQDLAFGLILVTIAGIAAAAGLASAAARSLAQPVQALRDAADQVGRGEVPSPFSGDAPGEFVPVMHAFERMAADVHATRAALDGQRRRTAAVLRNVATGVVALDEQLGVSMANPSAEHVLGRRLSPGQSIVEVMESEWQPVWEWVRAALHGREEVEAREFTIGEREIRVQVARLTGEGTGCVVALDDTTDLARAVRVLAWGELARQVAHEIKNPLTPMRLGIQHLRRAYDSPRGDYPTILDRTSRQMLAEIERLDAIARAFSRFGAPPAESGPLEDTDLVGVARDAAALYAMGDGEPVRVRADGPARGRVRPDELKEVLINLVENARTAGALAVTITVNGTPRPAIRIQDDGRGIPPEDLPRIFEPQFSTTTSGTGLGLAICKRLVESWGGEIEVESAIGTGTTVTITI